jgi:putative YhdH/YhfP family quinone oxidoreductase
MLPESFSCYLVKKTGKDQFAAGVESRPLRELPPGDVLIEVAYSSLNYKDAMAAQGHPGVARKFPHVPGIDAAGTVLQSASSDYQLGDQVVVTSYELGVQRWGGWSQYVRVPAEWIVPLPHGLSLVDSMTLGTAGLTAGLCIRALQQHDVGPDAGEVVVTGATGGVGSLAVMLLGKIGYNVVAVSGKADRAEWLKSLGASRVVGRDAIMDSSTRPLLSARWAGVIDTVGGPLLASALRSVNSEGCVAACGVVGGAEVNTTVYPFILRGVTLRGIETAWCPLHRRQEVWDLLAGAWKLESLDSIRNVIGLSELTDKVEQLHAGSNVGRNVVDVKR